MSLATAPRRSTPSKSDRTQQAREQATRLGAYTTGDGREREIVSAPGAGDSTLVIDRDALTRLDERLVAHLPADECEANSRVMCRLYLADTDGRHCRRVSKADRETPQPTAELAHPADPPAAGTLLPSAA